MSALNPPADVPRTVDPQSLRIVLFGMPDAGKSSLLGALAQAAHGQERALHGNLADLSQGLGELRNRVYDDRQPETKEEIVPYPVRYSPYGEPSKAATLYDCDGRAANDLLTQKRSIEKENREGTLAGAVLSADALILTVDASAPHSQIEDDFREFLRFLRFLEKHRTKGQEVGGFPVYLVLTKCDKLAADASISRSMWDARIDERKRDVMARFKHFLAGEAIRGGEFTFGSIDLEVRATATKHPELTNAPPQPREPFGVAELFATAFAEGEAFRQRRKRSRKRLLWTVGAAATLLAALLIGGAIIYFTPDRGVELTLGDRIEAMKAAEGGSAATRLGPNLERRLKEWEEIEAHSGFPELPDDQQRLVRSRLEEGAAYTAFRDDLANVPPPAKSLSLSDLIVTEGRLLKITPPDRYRDEWAETDAVKQRDEALLAVPTLKAAVARLTQFYFSLTGRAATLLQATELNADWEQAAKALLEAERVVPFPKDDPQLGPAHGFDDVTTAAADWQAARDRLSVVRDLATALGLIGDGSKAPLALTPPGPDADLPSVAAVRWQSLQSNYPKYASWTLAAVPDALRPEIERRLRRSIEQANADGRRIITERLGISAGAKPQPADWARAGESLAGPALKEWRDLTAVLAKLADPTAESPADATANFLRQSSFELSPTRVEVRIPDTLSDAPVRPSGDLVLDHGGTRLALRLAGDPRREKQTVVFTYAGTGKLTYRPGDPFAAELPVRKGDRDLKLSWTNARTSAFQFEKLLREPQLHAPEQPPTTAAVGVTATVTEGKFPTVPAMVPADK